VANDSFSCDGCTVTPPYMASWCEHGRLYVYLQMMYTFCIIVIPTMAWQLKA